MPSTPRFPDEELPPVVHGPLATWWDATSAPSYLAASLAKGEPRVHPLAYAVAAIAAGGVIAIAVTRVQLTWQLDTFGATDTLPFLEPIVLAERAAHLGLHLLAVMVATALFALSTKVPVRDVLRVRSYTLGPISHLYAWWTMYRWLRERDPDARRPEAWALMSFTMEWGLSLTLAAYVGIPLRDIVLDMVRGILPL